MRLFPTSTAVDVAATGIGVTALGLVLRAPLVVGWGGAMLLGVAIARAATLVSIARIRASGFEMVWAAPARVVRTVRGGDVTIAAEVRNRDARAARFVAMRAVASDQLGVTIDPDRGEVPGGGAVPVTVRVHAPRVGRHAVHGLSLEVRGHSGLFEIPLAFTSPIGVEVWPAAFGALLASARGGRSRLGGEQGRPGMRRGDGTELRELRAYAPGDPFRKIAWKPSARRGTLLVRETEREERDLVWLALDASVELWGGPVGAAPLDLAVEEVAARAARHLARGDRVGLVIVGGASLARVPPGRGPAHATLVARTLAHGALPIDARRTEPDERDVIQRVADHLSSLDPAARDDIRDAERLAERAALALARAPFGVPLPDAPTERERVLRRYLAAFGVHVAPRAMPEGERTRDELARQLEAIAAEKPRASLIYVAAPAPTSPHEPLRRALERLRRHGARVEWIAARVEPSLAAPREPMEALVDAAVRDLLAVDRARGLRVVRGMGASVSRGPHAKPAGATQGRTSR